MEHGVYMAQMTFAQFSTGFDFTPQESSQPDSYITSGKKRCSFPSYLVSCHNTNLETITKVTSVIDVDKCRLLMDGPEILCIPPP